MDNLVRVEVLYEENNLSFVNNLMLRIRVILFVRYFFFVWIKNVNNIFDGIGYYFFYKEKKIYKINVSKN